MLDELRRVKPAVDAMAVDEHSYVLVDDGFIYANDSRMIAAARTKVKGTFLAPCAQLSTVLGVVSADSIKVRDHSILLQEGSITATIKTQPPENFKLLAPPVGTTPLDEATFNALRAARAFMSDDRARPWACALRLYDGAIYVTNNISAVRFDAPAIPSNVDLLVPDWLVKYVAAQPDAPLSFGYSDKQIAFHYADGWVSSVPISGEMPDKVLELTEEADASFELSDEWKDAYRRVCLVAHETVVIGPGTIRSGTDIVELSSATASPVEDETIWHPKFLSLVVDIASHFDAQEYPRPASFKGPGCRGVIMGKV